MQRIVNEGDIWKKPCALLLLNGVRLDARFKQQAGDRQPVERVLKPETMLSHP
jgi:hypothetical protein